MSFPVKKDTYSGPQEIVWCPYCGLHPAALVSKSVTPAYHVNRWSMAWRGQVYFYTEMVASDYLFTVKRACTAFGVTFRKICPNMYNRRKLKTQKTVEIKEIEEVTPF